MEILGSHGAGGWSRRGITVEQICREAGMRPGDKGREGKGSRCGATFEGRGHISPFSTRI